MKFKICSFLKMALCYLMGFFLIIKLGMCGIGMYVFMLFSYRCLCMWRLWVGVWMSSSITFSLVFETGSFTEPRTTDQLDWLANIARYRLQMDTIVSGFQWVLAIQTQVLMAGNLLMEPSYQSHIIKYGPSQMYTM